MTNGSSHQDDWEEELTEDDVSVVAERIYAAHLPQYLMESRQGGRPAWYKECLREQLDGLVMSEVYDPERLRRLESIEGWVALVFGIFGAAFRILDHVGMHLRAQTFGQYELLPEDASLLRHLCSRFSEREPLEITPFM